MNKKVYNKINTIIVVFIILISNIIIVTNLKKTLQWKSYLQIDSKNREYIEQMISENYKLMGKLDKVAYMGGLGDWYLYLYYEDGTEDETLLNDGEGRELEEYIVENGYNEGLASWNKIKVSFLIIIVTIFYEVLYLIIKSMLKKKKEINLYEK